MYLGISLLPRYVCTWYQPADERSHTSDDSYMYQLSLVVATATVSYFHTWYQVLLDTNSLGGGVL